MDIHGHNEGRRRLCYSASDGSFKAKCTIPYTFGCKTAEVRAYHPGTGKYSNVLGFKVAFNTDITVNTNKTTYAPGESMTISGTLKYAKTSATDWVGLAGRTVSLQILKDTTVVWSGTATTGSDGSYSVTTTAPTTAGSYTVQATYAGEGLAVAGAVAIAPVGIAPVGIPPALSDVLPMLVAIGVPLALAYAESKRLIK